MAGVAKFLRLSVTERRLLLEAAASLLMVRLVLAFVPFRSWHRWFSSLAPRRGQAARRQPSQAAVLRAVAAGSQSLPFAWNCLVQALAAYRLLLAYGYTPVVTIGVRCREDGSFESHAWLEAEEGVLLGALPYLHQFNRLMGYRPCL